MTHPQTQYINSLTHSHTHTPLTHSPTHSLTHPLIYSLTHPPTHSLTHRFNSLYHTLCQWSTVSNTCHTTIANNMKSEGVDKWAWSHNALVLYNKSITSNHISECFLLVSKLGNYKSASHYFSDDHHHNVNTLVYKALSQHVRLWRYAPFYTATLVCRP